MNGHELLMIFGVPAMFLVAGAFGYYLVQRETQRFDKKHGRHAH